MFYQQLILLFVISSTCKGQDVVLTTTHECCNVNDELTLEAEYKGSGTVACVMWTITGGATSMIINVTTCSRPFPIPSGFPHGRMSYDCSSAPKYRLTVQTVERADLNKIWGVDFSLLTGSTSSGIQQQTVTQCEIVDDRNTGFPWWTIGLISLAVCVVAILYCVYRYKQRLRDWWNEESIPHTNIFFLPKTEPPTEPNTRLTRGEANEAKEDIRHESDNNPAKEFDEGNTNEEISNVDKVKTNSENNSLKTKPLFLNNDTGLLKRKRKQKKKRALHTI